METAELGRLIDHITVAENMIDEARLIAGLTGACGATVLAFVNANTMNIARDNNVLLQDLLDSSLLLRDGIGMSILLRLLGKSPGLNSNGTDFIPKVARQFEGKPIALLGTQDVYVRKAAEYTRRLGCNVVVAENGFHEPESYLEKIEQTRPELVVLGMSSPKQERVARVIARNADYPVVIVNGGAILDRWGGRFRRAPLIVRHLRLEWMFRLALEPRRLWRRYLIGNLRFLTWAVGLAIAGARRAMAATDHAIPHTTIGAGGGVSGKRDRSDPHVTSNSDGLQIRASRSVGLIPPHNNRPR
jgi:exopolysaccharide biosynthesis WecB/TagA/CpsF family protein